ncbi:OmpH family outer membrane protein [Pyxidicoccus sp. MSG2]|uniref:OmpH family outer membrane protein n=1 Tax=Pyxidicoccus sp. MSG2 TaxID=2996790 RepID=UPI00226D6798|nr:OmpH family outer membrane protein [Pyxidicoccus sp. MSG2]MCY1021875.1 OmpH family outer membrane protein [Pyxidicoccus sp. MSG2]
MSLRTTIAAAAAVVSLALPVAASAEQKIAFVDLQRVLLEVDDGKAAKARLQKWLDERQKEIDREQDTLRKEKELLDKQASAMSPETKAQKEAELQRKVMVLAQKWEKSRAEAANKERQEMEPIVGKIDQVIAGLAERDDLSFVLEKRDSGLVFARSQHDISNEVIRAYNSAKKPAAAPKDAPTKDAPKK